MVSQRLKSIHVTKCGVLKCALMPASRAACSMFAVITFAICFFGAAASVAATAPTSVYLQTPALASTGTTNVTSPVHFQATAESTYGITGYAIYVDNNEVYLSTITTLDTWVVISSGTHTVHITAWDSNGGYTTIPSQNSNYSIDVTGFAPPTPPPAATEVNVDNTYSWAKQSGAGSSCSTGTIGTWSSTSDPNTANAPDPTGGQHFTETNSCGEEDNSLFAWKDDANSSNAITNFLWDYWFYVPTSTAQTSVQAFESDLFFAVEVNDGNVHEFMFGSQCYYDGTMGAYYWEFAYPQSNEWTASSDSCQPTRPESATLQAFAPGTWHHATVFYQRMTPNGSSPAYQHIVSSPTASNDTNTEGQFGTLTIDGYTYYLGDVVQSSIPSPAWSPVLGVQHQLDMPASSSGQTIDEYVDQESVYVW
jgi:hypothetical protein